MAEERPGRRSNGVLVAYRVDPQGHSSGIGDRFVLGAFGASRETAPRSRPPVPGTAAARGSAAVAGPLSEFRQPAAARHR